MYRTSSVSCGTSFLILQIFHTVTKRTSCNLTIGLCSLLLGFTITTSCASKKAELKESVLSLKANVDSLNASLQASPIEMKHGLKLIGAKFEHSQVRYIYSADSKFMQQLDAASTRKAHRESLLPGGNSYELGKKLVACKCGIGYIYTAEEDSDYRIAIEFTPEEVRQLCTIPTAADSTQKK